MQKISILISQKILLYDSPKKSSNITDNNICYDIYYNAVYTPENVKYEKMKEKTKLLPISFVINDHSERHTK